MKEAATRCRYTSSSIASRPRAGYSSNVLVQVGIRPKQMAIQVRASSVIRRGPPPIKSDSEIYLDWQTWGGW